MKRAIAIFVFLAMLAAAAGPAFAQNASQIAGVRAGARSCAGCNLFQAEFSYMDLRGRNFAGARLRQSDLSLTEADNANFARADLSIANLFGARLSGANLTGANMERAVLVGAYLGGARMSGANLTGANLSGADLAETHGLTQAQLNGACGDPATTLPGGLIVSACAR